MTDNGCDQPGAVLIVIDGCRSDALQVAEVPNLQKLMSLGSYTLKAQTVVPTLTLPVHFSIFTSLPPDSHQVLTNAERPHPAPLARSIIEIAKLAGKKTAAFYNWENLRSLSLPGFLDHALFMANSAKIDGDLALAECAIDHLLSFRPDFCFIYLGGVDECGHRHGFMSRQYLRSIEMADFAVGAILKCLEDLSASGSRYHILLQSDHGGSGNSHDAATPEVLDVPWVTAGPDIHRGRKIQGNVSVLDTAPTLARLLNLSPDPAWQGNPVQEIFNHV